MQIILLNDIKLQIIQKMQISCSKTSFKKCSNPKLNQMVIGHQCLTFQSFTGYLSLTKLISFSLFNILSRLIPFLFPTHFYSVLHILSGNQEISSALGPRLVPLRLSETIPSLRRSSKSSRLQFSLASLLNQSVAALTIELIVATRGPAKFASICVQFRRPYFQRRNAKFRVVAARMFCTELRKRCR